MLKKMGLKKVSLILLVIMVLNLALSLVSFAGDEEWPWGAEPPSATVQGGVFTE